MKKFFSIEELKQIIKNAGTVDQLKGALLLMLDRMADDEDVLDEVIDAQDDMDERLNDLEYDDADYDGFDDDYVEEAGDEDVEGEEQDDDDGEIEKLLGDLLTKLKDAPAPKKGRSAGDNIISLFNPDEEKE